MERSSDLRVKEIEPLDSPRAIKSQYAASPALIDAVLEARSVIARILRGDDPRLLVVAGPCSIHDPEAAMEYAGRLNSMRQRFQDRLFIVMRTYFEKPRTTVGWRGLLNDPHLDGSFDMSSGLVISRRLLLHIAEMGLPTATEMLDPISPQYIADLVALSAIGARTTEAQTHRALASGLSMPVAFKNATNGSIQVAVDAMVSAREEHSFFGVDEDGRCCVVKTTGNPETVLVLRGARGAPNYGGHTVDEACRLLAAAGLPEKVVIDCSHANSNYDHRRQEVVWREVLEQRARDHGRLVGMMMESNLLEGKQSPNVPPAELRYGVSITDACIGWDTTEILLEEAYAVAG